MLHATTASTWRAYEAITLSPPFQRSRGSGFNQSARRTRARAAAEQIGARRPAVVARVAEDEQDGVAAEDRGAILHEVAKHPPEIRARHQVERRRRPDLSGDELDLDEPVDEAEERHVAKVRGRRRQEREKEIGGGRRRRREIAERHEVGPSGSSAAIAALEWDPTARHRGAYGAAKVEPAASGGVPTDGAPEP